MRAALTVIVHQQVKRFIWARPRFGKRLHQRTLVFYPSGARDDVAAVASFVRVRNHDV
jgi:hypothetical protein